MVKTGAGWLIFLFGMSGTAIAHPALSANVREADDYYLGRHNLENIRKALGLLRARVGEDPQDYEAWWRLAKSLSYLARHTSGTEKVKSLEEGIEAGRKAVALRPNRVEAHFWLGANYGLLAEERGPLKALFMADTVRRELEAVVRLDPEYEEAGGERTLALWYYRAPFFKGGDKRRSAAMLEGCLKRYPQNSLAMLYLADSLLALGRRDEARKQLEKMLQLCPEPLYGPEQADNQAEARARLAKEFGIAR